MHGQSLVEFALIAPLLILITMGIIDGGYYIYSYSELENATRRASEIAAKAAPNNSACIAFARSEALKSVFLSDTAPARLPLSFSYPSGRAVNQPAVVSVSYTGAYLTPIARGLFGPTFSFSFSSRRTILSTAPIFDANNNPVSCS
jgi:Flp pilus assembly protein TadG